MNGELNISAESMIEDLKRNDLNELIKYVKDKKALIAGGYVLQFLCQERFVDSDIDVFVPWKGEFIDDKKTANEYIKDYFKVEEIMKMRCRQVNVEYFSMNHIKYIIDIEHSNKKIQR